MLLCTEMVFCRSSNWFEVALGFLRFCLDFIWHGCGLLFVYASNLPEIRGASVEF